LIGYIYPDDIPKITLELAKPNREIIGRIKDLIPPKQSIKYGQISDMDFSIPYVVERDFMKVDNPIIPKVKSQYHIKATFGNQIEWFVITNITSNLSDNGVEYLEVQSKSLGYQLRKKQIREWLGVYINGEYQKEGLNAQQILNDLLSESSWSVDYIDSEYLTKYRGFDISNTTVLDAVYKVAETFGAILQWNTINKSISLIKPENAGINRGFTISDKYLMKSINKEVQAENVITILRVYGKDGLSINRINPLGTEYITDYSFFIGSFERDANKNVITSSEYMSDSLCHALLDYQILVDSKKGEFDNLLTQKESLEAQLITKNTELIGLETNLKITLNTIDLKRSTNEDVTVELQTKSTLESQITTKKVEITNVISQINSVDSHVTTLKNQLSTESNFTPSQIIELDEYHHIETWEDQNYVDDTELYKDAWKVLADLNKPKEIITTDIINVFKLQEAKSNWQKVVIGDKFFIHYERFGIDIEAQLVEMEIDHGSNSLNITIANTKDIERDEEKWAKMLMQNKATTNTVNMNKYKYDQINNLKTSVDDILSGKWNPAMNGINAGNQTVLIDDRGITTTNKNDPNKFVRITHGGMGFTNDGGNTHKTFVDATGVYAEALVGKIVITENLFIENESGNYVFDGNGFTITSTDEKKRVLLDVDNGLKFQTKVGSSYVDKLYYDSNAEILKFDGEGDFQELKVKGQSVLTGDKSKINGQYVDSITTDQLVAGTAKITNAMIESLSVDKLMAGTMTADITSSAWYKFTGGSGIYESSNGIMMLSANTVTFEPGSMVDFTGTQVFGLNINVVFG
jgi:hypothetical protein